MQLQNSPVQRVCFEGRTFYLKRDDLLHPIFGGNKARKLYYFFTASLPIKQVVSYGSLQSNAMCAIAALAKMRGWKFLYYARINQKLLQNPRGNLACALAYGMELKDIAQMPESDRRSILSETRIEKGCLFIPEGARCQEARVGVARLAQEIKRWAIRRDIVVFLPSGTGTTALFLQKELQRSGIVVMTTPCVGDRQYLKEQFFTLEPDERFHPTIIDPPKRYRFAKLYPELFSLWQRLAKETGVVFDLLYDPIGFAALLHHDLLAQNLLYIHQGGVLGSVTMEERYKKKFATIS